ISVLIPTHTHKGTSLGSLLRTSCAHGVSNLITCPESVLNFRGSHGCETKGIKLTRYTHVSQIKKEGTWLLLLLLPPPPSLLSLCDYYIHVKSPHQTPSNHITNEMAVGIALSYIAQWTKQEPYVMNNYKFCSVERVVSKKATGEIRKAEDEGEDVRDRRKQEKEEREQTEFFGFGAKEDNGGGDY
ncbi:hypothetical protein TL16_g08028, partial [Triparma laevis f. inornata]